MLLVSAVQQSESVTHLHTYFPALFGALPSGHWRTLCPTGWRPGSVWKFTFPLSSLVSPYPVTEVQEYEKPSAPATDGDRQEA